MRATPLPPPALETAPARRRRPARDEPATECWRLLEFVWATRAGQQPVLYLVRTLLH